MLKSLYSSGEDDGDKKKSSKKDSFTSSLKKMAVDAIKNTKKVKQNIFK